ncbi:uncharacterized protein LTR77_009867 [Saxophila tyrrhenica]|uniref:5'-nucleotidase n=1 Tax=Saxophila tyrrhenica TaxID=1690608 RepID=A0AAV9NXH9_9PEZI|nr:hypothetical protein LTR77_009867 [Saxophila tyrrhenica]
MKAEETTIHKTGREGPPDLRLLHFNDVYHPATGTEDPVGGIARFQTVCNYYRDDEKFKDLPKAMTFFSGDALNPSRESTVTKGAHMVEALNNIGIDAATVGNHEFDFGEANFKKLAQRCDFPWLLANLDDPNAGENMCFGQCEKSKIIEASNGLKIGILGLVEKEWLEKINTSLPASLQWREPIEVAKEIAPQLREQGADIVIALTHMRQPRDFAFGDGIPEGLIDLILGGHDHEYEYQVFKSGATFLRSGSDFKNLSYVEARRKEDAKGWDFDIVRRDIVREIPEDEKTSELAERLVQDVHRKLGNRIGFTSVPLDARFDTVGQQESNYANFVADLMRLYYEADCAVCTAFTIKGDQVYPPGELFLRNLVDCHPFEDPVVVVRVKGKALRHALENGVSQYPEPAACFPQVSGIRYSFDGEAEAGKRIREVEMNGKALDENADYTVACRAFLASAKLGYEQFRVHAEGGGAEEVVSEEEGVLVSGLLRQYFASIEIVDSMKGLAQKEKNPTSQWDRVNDEMDKSHPPRESSSDGKSGGKKRNADDGSDDDEEVSSRNEEREKRLQVARKVLKRWRRVAGIQGRPELASEQEHGEFVVGWTKGIAPKLDGRIQMVSGQA